MTTPESKAERLEALGDYAALAELERIDALGPEEVKAELAARGVTPRDPDESLLISSPDLGDDDDDDSELDVPAQGPPAVPPGPRGVPYLPIALFVAAVVGAVVAGRYFHLIGEPDSATAAGPTTNLSISTTSVPAADRPQVAHGMRARAMSACDDARWSDCLLGLNQAAALDPEGDTADDVTALRRRAQAALDEKKRGP
jgi:hypothetical protein